MAPAALTTTEQPAITTETDTGYADVRVDGAVVASVDADTDAPTVRAIDPENPEDAAAEWDLAAADGAVETIVNEPAGYADVVVNEIIVATVRVDDGEVSVRAFSPERPQDALGEYELPDDTRGEQADE